jgi:hypothetical protein
MISSVVERCIHIADVAGSNPASSTIRLVPLAHGFQPLIKSRGERPAFDCTQALSEAEGSELISRTGKLKLSYACSRQLKNWRFLEAFY